MRDKNQTNICTQQKSISCNDDLAQSNHLPASNRTTFINCTPASKILDKMVKYRTILGAVGCISSHGPLEIIGVYYVK